MGSYEYEYDQDNLINFIKEIGKWEEYLKQFKPCPGCNNEMSKHPAISRKDNKTEICSQCGMKEALEVFRKATMEANK